MQTSIESLQILKDVEVKILSYDLSSSSLDIISMINSLNSEKLQLLNTHKRKCEFLFTRKLWQEFNIDSEIKYDKLGAPIIQNGKISISHTDNKVAIAYHPSKRIGLDIQTYSEKTERIKHKFANDIELEKIPNKDYQKLTELWSAKEAIYKMLRIQGLPFKSISINQIQDQIDTKIIHPGCENVKSTLKTIHFQEFVLAICLEL